MLLAVLGLMAACNPFTTMRLNELGIGSIEAAKNKMEGLGYTVTVGEDNSLIFYLEQNGSYVTGKATLYGSKAEAADAHESLYNQARFAGGSAFANPELKLTVHAYETWCLIGNEKVDADFFG